MERHFVSDGKALHTNKNAENGFIFYHFSNISFTKKDTQRPTIMEVALRSAHIFYFSYAQYILPLTKFVLTECDDGCKRLDNIASFQP